MQALCLSDSRSVTDEGLYYPSLFVGGTVGGFYFPEHDLVPLHLRSCVSMHKQYTDQVINRRTAFATPPQHTTLYDEALKPRVFRYSNWHDFQRYGDVVSNFIRVIKGWSPTSFSKENGVTHTKLVGSVEHEQNTVPSRLRKGPDWSIGYGSFPGLLVDDLPTVNGSTILTCKGYSFTLNTTGSVTSPNLLLSGTRSAPRSVMSAMGPALKSAINNGSFDRLHFSNGYWFDETYTNAAEINNSGVCVGIEYTIRVVATTLYPASISPYVSDVIYRMSYRFLPSVRTGPVNPFVTGTYSSVGASGFGIKIGINVTSRQLRTSLSMPMTGQPLYGGSVTYATNPFAFADYPSAEYPVTLAGRESTQYARDMVPEALIDFIERGVEYEGVMPKHRTRGFEGKVHHLLPDIRTSAVKSASEALSNAFDVLTTNHIETISELRDIGALLSPIKVFRRWYAVYKGKADMSFTAILDDLTDLKLAWEFAIDPSLAAVSEIVEKSAALKSRLAGSDVPRVVQSHGSFTYDLSEDFPEYSGTELITRTKIVVSLGASSGIMTMLGARALGIMPSLSNMWDIMPMSFILDWFTNMDDQLQLLDDQVFAKCLDLSYCVHSFSIRGTFHESDLDYYGLRPSYIAEDAPGVAYYRREKSRWYPALRESKYNWTQPSPPSDWGTVGSVLYKLAK